MSSGEVPDGDRSPDAKPGGNNGETGFQDGIEELLPDDSDTDGDGRTGVLSTRTEVHALVLGVTAGAHFRLSGDMQLINDVIGIAVAGDRARHAKVFPEKFIDQAKEELPYFLAGMAIGYAATRTNALSILGVGV